MNGLAGIALAFSASMCWSISPICFAAAGRKIGSLNVNILRLALASAMLIGIALLYTLCRDDTGLLLLPGKAIFWLALSGLSGLVIGDGFYLKALTLFGARRTTQVLTLSPIVSSLAAWLLVGEQLSVAAVAGIGMILAGVVYATAYERTIMAKISREPGAYSGKGLLLAAIATIFHGSGAVMSREAFRVAPAIDPVAAAAARVVASGIILLIASSCMGRTIPAIRQIRGSKAMKQLTLGVLAGPVIGMIFYVGAFKYAPAGIVSTLSSLSPLMILPIVAVRYRTKIPLPAIAGMFMAVVGMFAVALGR